MNINGKTKLFGILGNPVTHSLSPTMHNACFRSLGINGVYVPLPSTDAKQAIRGMRNLGVAGASVTYPFKEEVIGHLDEVDRLARQIGAVNTIVFSPGEDGRRTAKGYNTDWQGSNRALESTLELKGKIALVLGAGGAAKAVGFGLKAAGAEVIICNRTVKNGVDLAKWLDCGFVASEELDMVRADILINTTSVGMEPYPRDIPINPRILDRFETVMDIVYAPLTTRLLEEAATRGCRTIDGLAMLLHQGAAQFEIWTGQRPEVAVMRRAMLEALEYRR
ncbi:MAG: shikimate dehydrogenase [Desulfobulbus propionicus]|nr:MAG: shikimate dehydrogenase [Desulfobulbus propionicus]